jgi:phosphatidate cytidylyltransferase
MLMALWGIPLILGLSFLGKFYFLVLLLIINVFSLWEFYSIYINQKINAYKFLGLSFSIILLIASYYYTLEILTIIFLIILLGILIRHIRISQPLSTSNTALTITGIFYITIFLITLLKVRQNFSSWTNSSEEVNAGGIFFILLWISIWVCDTMAYFGGRVFGKHKLAPLASPNKTVEGAVFGFIGAIIIFIGIGPLVLPNLSISYFWIFAGIVGIFGQIGDLVESRFKRDANVKDTSRILPGHGGFLDRFDSIIFISPLLFILLFLLKP